MPKETFLRLRDEKQERILRAAIHEFVENGFDRAKIGDITQNAKVATGSIYQYFEDKKELFVYCAQWGLEVLIKKLNECSIRVLARIIA
ncbi:TetR/AcrR family transcriptional regulator [Desulfoscipio gibsoniae]|uniref:Transcriptional regulator n=1 Tax=Desulfoscipio gibsoniae DSM 7213 TaxID=767817 RepID=R4KT59_9FIRM|nr:TetR/AcrR family transcriptional regulator [Desulfoscipio gibsoniae]AGL02786.1 transcriptional regulator [Desulfoscipio gibsoniae DSM 7213]